MTKKNRKLAAATAAAKSGGIEKATLAVTKAVVAVKTKHDKETEKAGGCSRVRGSCALGAKTAAR